MASHLEKLKGKAVTIGEGYRQYFDLFIHEEDRVFLFAKEKAEVIERERDLCGYFVIVTSKRMSAKEALDLYKSRDACFDSIYDHYPTIYRIDRIQNMKVLDEHFRIPYRDRFEEGEYRKRIQFMYSGKLRKVKFCYKGLSIEAVMDRLPTARILREDEDGYVVEAEAFGDGIDMWLRGQGDSVEIIENDR